MIFFSRGSANTAFSPADLRCALFAALDQLGKRNRVLAIPPDFTRYHSFAGLLTELSWEYYGRALIDILPAIGTHVPMTDEEIRVMFGKVPRNLFRVHNWRDGLSTLGEVPASFVKDVSEGKVKYPIPIQVDRLLAKGSHDLILSLGQIVPHEVIGMAGHNKNVFVGTGGAEGINKTHFLGAVYGMEKVLYAIALGIDALRQGNSVIYTTQGRILFGEPLNAPDRSAKVKRVADLFDRAGINYDVPPDMLAVMHGSSFEGDAATQLRGLADGYDVRLREMLAASA